MHHASTPSTPNALPSRRSLLRAGAALGGLSIAGALVSCGDDTENDASGSSAATGALIASFPQSDPFIPAGLPTRLPYLIADNEGVPLETIDGPVRFTVRKDGKQIGEQVEVRPRSAGVPRAYLPLTVTFDEPGYYDVIARYQGADLDGSVEVVDRTAITTPLVGDPLPAIASPTTADPLGVNPLCTRPEPCQYHSRSLDAALGSSAPTILVVSTPAYCQTAVCGPILDMLVERLGGRTDINVIHSEVYKNPADVDDLSQAALAPIPEAFGLVFEPALFVADAAGIVVARGDLIIDETELDEMLAFVV